MKTHALTIKIRAKKPKNVRNCESAASCQGGLKAAWHQCRLDLVMAGAQVTCGSEVSKPLILRDWLGGLEATRLLKSPTKSRVSYRLAQNS